MNQSRRFRMGPNVLTGPKQSQYGSGWSQHSHQPSLSYEFMIFSPSFFDVKLYGIFHKAKQLKAVDNNLDGAFDF